MFASWRIDINLNKTVIPLATFALANHSYDSELLKNEMFLRWHSYKYLAMIYEAVVVVVNQNLILV